MPRSKAPENYPLQFVTIAERCAVHGDRVVLEFPEWQPALRMQQMFIAYTAAIRRIRDSVGHRKELTDYERHWMDQLNFASRTQVWVKKHEDGTATLTFQNREDSDVAKMLDAAKVIPGARKSSEAEEFFKSIAEEVKGVPSGGFMPPVTEVAMSTETEAEFARVLAAAQRGNRRAIAEMQRLGVFGEDGREIPGALEKRRKGNG